jgi:hypothetical protein
MTQAQKADQIIRATSNKKSKDIREKINVLLNPNTNMIESIEGLTAIT